MSDLNNIIEITISRETTAVSRAAFGTPAIIAEFTAGKTTVTFDRYRLYSSLTAMSDDGWSVYDPVYQAAQIIFSQNPKPPQVMVGRKDSADASWTAALNAIQTEYQDWYTFTVIAQEKGYLLFDDDLVTSNEITVTVNGTAITPVTYATSHANTMSLIASQIQSDITGATATVELDWDARLLSVIIDGVPAYSITATVTGGASQAGYINPISFTDVVFDSDVVTGNTISTSVNGGDAVTQGFSADHATTIGNWINTVNGGYSNVFGAIVSGSSNRRIRFAMNADAVYLSNTITGGASQPTLTQTQDMTEVYKLAAAWAETQKKIFFYSSGLYNIKTSETDDIASYMKAQNFDRTVSLYHPDSQDGTDAEYFETGVQGEALPYDPGSQTWAFKTISGVTAYNLTSNERTNVLGKNCGIYTETAGVSITENGQVASGEYIDIIRGIDDLESAIQAEIFSELVNVRKIPFTDEGITIVTNILQGVLVEKAAQGILVETSIVVTAPKAADVSTANKTNRLLPDITFTATLQGAVHKVDVSGVVSV